jgi:CHAT domain-containing protein/tetratricopeptide (TPR) repeat protein
MLGGRGVVSLLCLLLAQVPAQPPGAPATAAAALARAEQLRNQGSAAAIRASVEQYEQALALAAAAGDRVTEAGALTGLGRAKDALGDKRAAIALFERALPIQRAAGNLSAASYTLNFMALSRDFLGERKEAVKLLGDALELARAANDRRVEAVTLNNFGLLNLNLGDRRKALEYYEQALAINREVGNLRGQATTLTGIGSTYDALGEKQKAIDVLEQALPLRRQIGDPREEAATLNNLGVVLFTTDRLAEAVSRYEQAVPKWREAGDRGGEAATLHNMASILEAQGRYQTAIDRYNEALQLHRSSGYKASEGNTLNNLGSLYSKLGDHTKAIGYYEQALGVHRAVGNRGSEASTLSNIAAEHYFNGALDRALATFGDALTLWRANGDIFGEARTLVAAARAHSALRHYDDAAAAAVRARELNRKANSRRGEAFATGALAEIELARGNAAAARAVFAEALDLHRAISDRVGEAGTLYGLARAESASGALDEARGHLDQALQLVETFRTTLAAPDLRMTYFASMQDYFELSIDVLMRLHAAQPTGGWAIRAFETSERARARSFVDLMAEARVNIREGVDPELLGREREINAALSARAERQTRLLAAQHTDAQAAQAAADIRTLLDEREALAAKIRTTSPKYSALAAPAAASSDAIRQQLLDDNTLLLEFALGNPRSYVFAVTRNGVAGFVLPPRKEIDAAVTAFHGAARTPADLRAAQQAARRLADAVLAPVTDLVRAKRIAIVASGSLQHVPFGALPAPGADRPLLMDRDIVALPSVSALLALRDARGTRAARKPSVMLFADPVFTADDPRVVTTTAGGAPAPAAPRDAADAGLGRLDRLIGSRREAAGIAALLPPASVTRALDFDASRATATAGLQQYGIVHFATHSLLNGEHPELSGIVLSLVDRSGRPQDGFLGLNEVFNLKIDADLVVLSSCQSALGKDIRGEGVMGLSRAFMYAGAPRVVATAWKVDDAATAALMKRFYQAMLGPERMTPAAALRAAQLDVMKQPRWRAPYYWAPFVLQGDWR